MLLEKSLLSVGGPAPSVLYPFSWANPHTIASAHPVQSRGARGVAAQRKPWLVLPKRLAVTLVVVNRIALSKKHHCPLSPVPALKDSCPLPPQINMTLSISCLNFLNFRDSSHWLHSLHTSNSQDWVQSKPATQSMSPTWMTEIQIPTYHCCLPGTALARSWNQMPEAVIERRHPGVGSRHLNPYQ